MSRALLDDLRDESEELDRLVADLKPEGWATPTPAPRWTVAHQIAHLAWTDAAALLAVTDAEGFAAQAQKARAAPEAFVDEGADAGAAQPPAQLLARWREGRDRLQDALRKAPADARFPWYGPPMSAASMATARLMETWAHGQDVADALGAVRRPTARLRHVAWIGVRARDYAYAVRGIPAPEEPFRVELTAPDGPDGTDRPEGPEGSDRPEGPEGSDRPEGPEGPEGTGGSGGSNGSTTWAYGPEDAAQKVTGPALDFCLLVTQRAHRDDLAVRAEGAEADRWLDIAQAFAGPAGAGRAPKGAA
ncbi:TIGR03084 family metal-binding protein [Streptomyces ficellus]|uniref:TIGR03084 family metal-binding protein n=1 Tax=Streptomyces ficellus TaxID=1977088 RepID=A0ABT7Z685_9ACTN|nr:TIGR03084 family metal-binding protein [Streptomyces ficellus]MDN3295019.1 TIGR03084 family metal-binding protein [Streptomyces ficellus]